MKLISTKDYLLLADEEAEISKTGTLIYENDTNLLNITGVDYEPQGLDSKIIAYYPLTKEATELDLPLLPNPFEEEADIEQSDKKFSLEDMKKAIEMARILFEENMFDMEEILGLTEICTHNIRLKYSEEEIIQSLSTQQLPKEFIPEVYQNELYIKPEDLLSYESQPKEFQLSHTSKKGEVLKLKTTTNSEGKKELVGTYEY